MEWSERKFQEKVNERISSEIALSQVEMANKIEKMKKVLENIFSLYSKLCDPFIFTQETSQRILSLEGNLKVSRSQLPKDPAQSEKHFATMLHTQRELALLTTKEANFKEKIIQMQFIITPHMEVLHKEQAYAENFLKKDPNISTLDELVHLVVDIAIKIKSLEVALQNWDGALRIMIEVNKTFLAKQLVRVQIL